MTSYLYVKKWDEFQHYASSPPRSRMGRKRWFRVCGLHTPEARILHTLKPRSFKNFILLCQWATELRIDRVSRKQLRRFGIPPREYMEWIEQGLIDWIDEEHIGFSPKVVRWDTHDNGAEDTRERYTYLIQAGKDGPVKIGSSNNPYGRLDSLQTANPEKLNLLGYLRGGYHEDAMHREFASFRLHGEWFRSEVLDHIDLAEFANG